MADLFELVFSPYGQVHRYPRKAKLTGYEWSLECDLGPSFDFLSHKVPVPELQSFSEPEFIAFVSGLFDAEGSIYLHKKAKWHNPEVAISNTDADLLNALSKRIEAMGFHCSLVWREQRVDRRGVTGRSLMGRIEILRFLDVQRLVQLIPMRHMEEVERKELVVSLVYGSSPKDRSPTVWKWKELTRQVRREVHCSVKSAKEAVNGDKSLSITSRWSKGG